MCAQMEDMIYANCVFSVPSAGPGNVTAIAVSSTTIKVQWQRVSPSQQNGDIRGYKVQASN